MIMDAHSHFSRPFERKVARMDAAGIDRAVLVCATGNPEVATDAISYAEQAAVTALHIGWDGKSGAVRDAYAEMMTGLAFFPGRFVPLAPALFSDDRSVVDPWVEQCLMSGCAGFGEAMTKAGQAITLEASFAAAQDMGGALFLTSSYPPTTKADLEIYGMLAQRYPLNTLIIGHLGAGFTLLACELAAACANIFIEMSTHPNILAAKLCVGLASEKLLFGTNDPYCDPEIAIAQLAKMVPDDGLRREISGERLQALIGELKWREGGRI